MTDTLDAKRRRVLGYTACGIGAAGCVGSSVPFVLSMRPTERAKWADGARPVDVDIGGLRDGEMRSVEWHGRPIFVLRRTDRMLATLEGSDAHLEDPRSGTSVQPQEARNRFRSLRPEVLVCDSLCTHLGCRVLYKPDSLKHLDAPRRDLVAFDCRCHASHFDYAGRVFKGMPAPRNLDVPPHRYLSPTVIEIGEA